jgi:hypothetical protein
MNKYEQLIEHIINDDTEKARALFHTIVVEKSRDIYEGLIDEDDFEIGGNEVDDFSDDVTSDEEGLDDSEWSDEEMDHDFDSDGEIDGHESEHMSTDDQIEDLRSALEALQAQFDELSAGEEGEPEFDMYNDESEGEEFDSEEGEEDLEESNSASSFIFPEKGRFGYKMGGGGIGYANGQATDGIKIIDRKTGEVVSIPDFTYLDEEPSQQELQQWYNDSGEEDLEEMLVREYIEKVGEPYKGEMNRPEGRLVGKGTSTPINKNTLVAKPNKMGGTAANIVKGGANKNPDGTSANKGEANAYKKGEGKLKGAGSFENVPGAKAGKAFSKKETSYEKAKGAEGQTTSGKLAVNTKSEIGGKVR